MDLGLALKIRARFLFISSANSRRVPDSGKRHIDFNRLALTGMVTNPKANT